MRRQRIRSPMVRATTANEGFSARKRAQRNADRRLDFRAARAIGFMSSSFLREARVRAVVCAQDSDESTSTTTTQTRRGTMRTNRDLYRFIATLIEKRQDCFAVKAK